MVRQQAKIELGDQGFKDAYRRAGKWIKAILSKGWYDRQRLVINEGGNAALMDTALAYIVNAGSVDEGLAEYGRYLASEYGRNRSHNKVMPLPPYADSADRVGLAYDVLDDDLECMPAKPAGASDLGGRLTALQSERPGVEQLVQTEEERTLFETIGSVGSIADAIRTLGWDRSAAMRIWFRVYRRSRRGQSVQ